jgi:pyruvate formate lyase activating enzyme
MNLTLFTVAGCVRCAIAKTFMAENGLAYEELDAIAEGRERFGQCYRAHRGAIFRGKEGIEFPVLVQGDEIRQGVAAALAWLCAGTGLDGYIGRNELSKGWVGGVHVSGGAPAAVDGLVAVLGLLKANGLKLQLDTDGRNPAVLQRLLEHGIGDRVVMDLKGPKPLYSALVGSPIESEDVHRSMRLVVRFPEFRFETTVAPVPGTGEGPERLRYLTPDEIGETALWLKEATGSHRQPYVLRAFDPQSSASGRFRSAAAPPPGSLVRHRTAARRHQVLSEIQSSLDASSGP